MKALKKIWAAMFKRPKYVKLNSSLEGKLQVVEVERESNDLTTSLGMDPERVAYLREITTKAFITSESVVEVMVKVSGECLHANELYFVAHLVANMQRDQQVPSFIQHLMGGKRD